jgi:hypothetical protein
MNKESAYMNSNIFMTLLKEHFLQRKPSGKLLSILEGHASHCNVFEMLDFAKSNDIVLFCLPPYTTKYLQPLDSTFFKPLKEYYNRECKSWFVANKGRKITRLQFGLLFGEAWKKAATNTNAMLGIRTTGVYPLDENCVPEFAFAVSDTIMPPHSTSRTDGDAVLSTGACDSVVLPQSCASASVVLPQSSESASTDVPQPLTPPSVILHLSSKSPCSKNVSKSSGETNYLPPSTPTQHSQEETPTKILMELSPPPKISNPGPSRVKRSLHGEVLTTLQNIDKTKHCTIPYGNL